MKWFGRLWHKFRHWLSPQPLLKAIEVEELPEVLNKDRFYLVGENGYLWHAALLCPCGCAERLYLNLLPEQRPCWRIDRHADDTVSVHPSVWRVRGCGSHFFIRRGSIEWCIAESQHDLPNETVR